MGKIRLTKNELKRQKDLLKRYEHFLPALQLKRQQLQAEIDKIRSHIEEVDKAISEFRKKVSRWIGVFAEEIGFENLLMVEKVFVSEGNVAGVDIPVFDRVEFKLREYDLLRTPIWVDYGIVAVREMVVFKARQKVLQKQLELIREELRIVTQRVNLFEKVKIPETKENIHKISIWLGDLQTAEVVTGKIAKAKIEEAVMT